jgi:hypothetical protein
LLKIFVFRHRKSPQKKVASNRTVLISNRSTISNQNQDNKETTEISTDNQNDLHEEPKMKRIKIDTLSPSSNTTDEINQKDLGLKSIVTVPTITDDHDYRRDLNEKRRVSGTNNSVILTTDNSKPKSSRSRSRSKSKDHHHRRSSTNSHSSSIKNIKIVSESNEKSKNYSRSSSKDHQYRYQQKQNRNKYQYERKRSSDPSNHYHKQYSNQLSDQHEIPFRNSLSSIYHQRNINDLTLPTNLHHQQQQRQPVRHKRFNYNHQSVADHPRFSNSNVLSSPTPLMDFNYPKSPTHHRSTSPVSIGDRK